MNSSNNISHSLLAALLLLANSTAYANTAGYVQFVNGEVQLTTSAGQTHSVQKGEAVNEGDTIDSAKDASAQIKMQDGGFIAVRPGTQLKFDSFKFNGKEDGSEQSFFSLFKGGFRAVTGLIGRINKPSYRIATPAATIGIRGTDHESFYAPANLPGILAGAYSKVNIGETSLTTDVGTINVKPNQMGYAGGLNQLPKLQPINTNIFTVVPPPAKEVKKEEKQDKEEKGGGQKQVAQQKGQKEEQKTAGSENGKTTSGGDTQKAAGTSGEQAEIRSTAVVDNTSTAAGVSAGTTTPTAGGAGASTAEVALPPAGQNTIPVTLADPTTGVILNATNQTLISNTGQITTIQNGVFDAQAQAAADAALLAANAAANAASLAATNNTALTGIAQVSTAPATTAIGTASTSIGTASTALSAATALTPANATLAATNATTAQTAATTAAVQATAAQNALTANGTFADVTAGPANTATQNANSSLQAANTAVQTAAGTVTTQNTALTTAQGAASTALTSASTNLTTANTGLTTANTQNTAIVTAQGLAATPLTAAQTAATNAQAAAAAAQAAATLAASLQAAGDFSGAQAQMIIAQQQLAIAQAEQLNTQNAQAAVNAQLLNAQTAQTAAGTAVTSATIAATTAATDATTAQTQAAAAQTASTNANAALTASNTGLATVNTNATTVAANAPVAAYNNPAVVGSFIGHTSMSVPVTGGFNEAFTPSSPLQPNTKFVLDGSGNLVEMRNAQFQVQANQNGAVLTPAITGASGADIRWSGGTAADTFRLADNSIYMGRWASPTVTVTDNSTSAVYTYTPLDNVWAVLMPPTAGYVPSLVGSTTYTMAGHTTPVDAFGTTGVLNSATLSANFTGQVVTAAVNLTMSAGPMAGTFGVTANNMPIQAVGSVNPSGFGSGALTASCTGACANMATGYSADLGGSFAGTAAASAGMSYNIWPTTTASTPASDSVGGMVAFTTATPPTGPASPAAGNYNAGFIVPVAITGGYTIGRWIHTPPVANTTIQLDASGNLVSLLGASYQEPGTTISIPSANIRWSSTPLERFQSADGNITFGRYQGGSVTVTDTTGTVAPFTDSLAGGAFGPTSSVWAYGVATPTNYVQSLVGTVSYTNVGHTTPFDSVGGMGVLNSATLSANFTNQIVNAAVNLTMNTGAYASDVFNVSATMPINPTTAPDPSGFKTANPGGSATVTCGTGPCTGGAFSAEAAGTFSGATATDAVLGYGLWANNPVTGGPADIVNGFVGFNTATAPTWLAGGPFAAYTPIVALEVSTPFISGMGWGNYLIQPADLTPNNTYPTAGLSSFVQRDFAVSGYTQTNSVLGGATPVTANATSFATTGIQFGRWTSYTALQSTSVTPLGMQTRGAAPGAWMYGPQGYLDAAYLPVAPSTSLSGAMAGTFSYALDGATVPHDSNSGLNGTLTSASLSANFTAMTLSLNLGLTMPGNENWAASASNLPIWGNQFFASSYPGSMGNNLTVARGVGVPATTCGNCFGNVAGAFTGQNYAGAIISYNLGDQGSSGSNIDGHAALSRNYTGNTNPAVSNGTPAPTGNIMVADWGGSVQPIASASATTSGNLLTAYGSGNPATPAMGYMSTTVACTGTTGCTTNPSGNVATSGIYYGTWDAGTYTDSFGGFAGGNPYWITGPEAGPTYLAQALTGTASYALDGGMVTNRAGVAGTVLGTTALTVNFTRQVVGINLDVSIQDTAATPVVHTWNAATPAGQEAILGNGPGLGGGAFQASSYNGGRPGTLTISTDGTINTSAYGDISGQLTGTGLNGAIMSFNLGGPVAGGTWENINGVAALAGPASSTATPYRGVLVSLADPFTTVPQPVLGGYANAASRVTAVGSSLTQFDTHFMNSGGNDPSNTLAINTSTPTDTGTDAVTGISWGRWQGGAINATDRASGTVQAVNLGAGSLHWIAGPVATGPATLPITGTFAYTYAGGTTPTDNLGNTGVLNVGSTQTHLTANFTAMTVDVGVNATISGATLNAAAAAAPIIQGSGFFASSQMAPGTAGHLAVTCTGTCGGSQGGTIGGGFGGAGAMGAVMSYGLQNGATTISGVAAFHR